jgi:probable addiction module antidote protein
MKSNNHKKWDDVVKDLLAEDEELQFGLIKTAFEESYDMPNVIMSAIRQVAEVRGVSQLALDAELNRENLYRALSGNTFPRIDTFFKIINALGLRLTVEPRVS